MRSIEHSDNVPMVKLTRKAVKEALEQVPIDHILVGAGSVKLTPKQRRFAEGVAMGKSKAQAYREAYDSSAKPHHQSVEGQRLAAHPAIAHQIEALRLADEARKHATPAALRSLVIQQLTEHAINPDINPAQRLRALELLGKVTEVAAFTNRTEVTHHDGGQVRERLIAALRSAIVAEAVELPSADAVTLELELSPALEPAGHLEQADEPASAQAQAHQREGADAETPPHPDPPRAHERPPAA